jgi:hypothetical protein
MRSMLAEMTAADFVDSLEIRWIVPGWPTAAMRGWFAALRPAPSARETREDAYLIRPRLRGLSVKLRAGSELDVKALRGSGGVLNLPGGSRGRAESWRKWSFSYEPVRGDPLPVGWTVVRKRRIIAWFPLAAEAGLAGGEASCAAELAEVLVRGEPWASVGFEAHGSPGLLRHALYRAVGVVFAAAPAGWPGFDLDHCRSYSQWLYRLPGGLT